jgi:hypothetical protein
MGQLDGKVAIVTGSGRGIGQQVALVRDPRRPRDRARAGRAPSFGRDRPVAIVGYIDGYIAASRSVF